MTLPAMHDRAALIRELTHRFHGRFTGEEVTTYLNDAITELRGSVSLANLPELAVRLAAVRMDRVANDTWPA